jgi:hypothetical protein
MGQFWVLENVVDGASSGVVLALRKGKLAERGLMSFGTSLALCGALV